MLPIGQINAAQSPLLGRIEGPSALKPSALTGPTTAPVGEGFGQMLDNFVAGVDAKQAEAQAVTRTVLLGENSQIHQSIIAMQEASVAFSLMVEVRNKLVESYQELMRMQV